MTEDDGAFDSWMSALETRHLADLQFAEVSRALRALSSTYVERRRRISEGGALSGAGKRAAFALFYGPLHYLLIREIVTAIPGATENVRRILDLGCGTGAAGAGWATACMKAPSVLGIDRHPWAIAEAARTYRAFGLSTGTRIGDIGTMPLPQDRTDILAAFTLNELPNEARDRVLTRLLDRPRFSGRLLIVEPLAGFVAPWWGRWRRDVEAAGGRADEWRVRVDLPAIVAKLDRAAGLHHRELTGRSLWLS